MIPTPEDVTPRFLTECLRAAGHRDVSVERFTAERIGTGQIGRCYRYALELGAAEFLDG